MKVLIVGDVHGTINHVRYVFNTAQQHGVTIVFFAGDFGAWEHTADGVKFFDQVQDAAERYGITVYWLDGNHDKTSLVLELYGDNMDDEGFLVCRPRLRYAPRGHRWTWGDVRFMAFGGAYSVDKAWRLELERENTLKSERRAALYSATPKDWAGAYWFPEEEATDKDVDEILSADSTPVDVLLTHDKPRASNPGWNRKDIPECWPNQDRIQRIATVLHPKVIVHGHLHYPYMDSIRVGDDDQSATVVGVDCETSGYHPGYNPADSWLILNLDVNGAPIIEEWGYSL